MKGRKFHISRWKYWYGYLVIFVLLVLTIYFRDRAIDAAAWFFGVFTVVLIVLFEYLIRLERVTIGSRSFEYVEGIPVKNVSRVKYESVGKAAVHQTPFEKMMRYGTVVVDTPGKERGEVSFILFQEPSKIAKLIGKGIEAVHKGHGH